MPDPYQTFRPLLEANDATELNGVLRTNSLDYFLAFYGMTDLEANEKKNAFENVFGDLLGISGFRQLVKESEEVAALRGLLVLFASFFERHGIIGSLQSVLNVLPASDIRSCLELVSSIKQVHDANTGYLAEFEQWLLKNPTLGKGTSLALQEFYFHASEEILAQGASEPWQRLKSKLNKFVSSTLVSPELNATLSSMLLVHEDVFLRKRLEANSQVVEWLFAQACELANVGQGQLIEPDAVMPEYSPSDHMKLPDELDKLLFSSSDESGMGAIYEKGQDWVTNCLDATEDEQVQKYLGTYFPRSFLESKFIFSSLLNNGEIFREFRARPCLRILDLGGGTGGNLLGLLDTLAQCSFRKPIEIVAVDGNEKALTALKKVLKNYGSSQCLNITSVEIKLVRFDSRLEQFSGEISQICAELEGEFDIIMSWKFLNELYRRTLAQAMGTYRVTAQCLESKLSANGICVFLDLCDRIDGSVQWIPTIVARELNQYIQQPSSKLSYVLPLSCALWGLECQATNCYTQKIISVEHSQARNDVTKVCFRVLGSKKLTRSVMTNLAGQEGYSISPTGGGKSCWHGGIIKESTGHLNLPDAHVLP
jgi:hypothetical protein